MWLKRELGQREFIDLIGLLPVYFNAVDNVNAGPIDIPCPISIFSLALYV